MKRSCLYATIASMLLATSVAFAAPDHGPKDHGHPVHGYDGRDFGAHHDSGPDNQRWEENGGHDNGRHLGQHKHAFRRGDRVPMEYLQSAYYVRDYRAYHLAPPPRGYRWVRPEDGHYLLVALATGVISELLGY